MVELSRAIYSLKIYLGMIPKLTKEHTIAVKTSRIIDTYNLGQILTIEKKEKVPAVFDRKKTSNQCSYIIQHDKRVKEYF